jgi:V/A-type H+-transporting ATPase subunit C
MSSDEAMAVKARAMFGKRLTESDYQNLLQKKTVPEIASALKGYPLFAETLEGINEKSIHRGQLEALLRMDAYYRLQRLTVYGGPNDGKFFYIVVMNTETRLILSCIRAFMRKDDEIRNAIIGRIPVYAEQYFSFDVKKLIDVNNYDELEELLKGTRFYSIVKKYRAEKLEDIDFIGMEHAFRISNFKNTQELIDEYSDGDARDQMRKITRAKAELDNIAVIYRLKRYFNASSGKIQSLIMPEYCLFTAKEMRDMICDCTADEVVECLQKKYHRYAKGVEFIDIEHYTGTIRYNLNHHFIEYYTEASLVLLSYMVLAEIEIQNVINIIEGVRYGVSPDRIKTLLVY